MSCGCMATRHSFLTSCIECGKIFCEKESSTTCSFCYAIMMPKMSSEDAQMNYTSDNILNAYKLKDKLIRFDKENAKRTQVYDAQMDYYESSNWLSVNEKEIINAKEMERKLFLNTINKPTSTVSLSLKDGMISSENLYDFKNNLTLDNKLLASSRVQYSSELEF